MDKLDKQTYIDALEIAAVIKRVPPELKGSIMSVIKGIELATLIKEQTEQKATQKTA